MLLSVSCLGSHVLPEEVEQVLSNVRVLWLPANCTALIQPLDQGIIHSLKAHYRKLLLRHILSYYELHKVWILLHLSLFNESYFVSMRSSLFLTSH